MSSIRISELPLIADINDLDVLVINEGNIETKGIELRNFIGSLTGKDLNFTGTITLDDVVVDGNLTVSGNTTYNNQVIFNDPVVFNDTITFPGAGVFALNDLTDVNTAGAVTGDALVYNASIPGWIATNTGSLDAVVDDPTPTLGGDLDVNGHKILSRNNGNVEIEANGNGLLHILGGNGTNQNAIRIYDEINRNFISITVPEAADLLSTLNLQLPADAGQPGWVLKTDGSGNLTWAEGGATGGGGGSAIDLTDLSVVTGLPKEGGELDYNNLNGVFTFNPADVSDFLTADDLNSTISIDDLSDVDTTTNAPGSGQALVWNGTDNWVPGDVAADATEISLGELKDVDTTGANDGDILIYDSAAGEWQAADNIVPSALTYRGICDLAVAPTAVGNEDVDTTNLVSGFFWVYTGGATTIDAGWAGLSGTANGGEYVVYTINNTYSILGDTGGLAPIVEIQAGTGIEVDETPDAQRPTVSLADTAVVAGTYNMATITVDAQGRITGATANGTDDIDTILGDYLPLAGGTLTGDLLLNDQITLTAASGQAEFKGHIYTGDGATDGVGANISDTNEGVQFNSDDGGNFFRGYNTTSGEFKFNVFADGQVVSPNIKTPLISADSTVNIEVAPSGGGKFIVKGDTANTIDGSITLNCHVNTHGVTIQAPPHSASATYTLILPENTGTNGQALISDGSGVLSWGDAGANVSTSPTPPASDVKPGDLWYDTDVGILYVYYKDANNDEQWVDTRPSGGSSDSTPPFTMDMIDIPSLTQLPS